MHLLIPDDERVSRESDVANNLLNSAASMEPLLKIDSIGSDPSQLQSKISLMTLEELVNEIICINSSPEMTALRRKFRAQRRQIPEEALEEFASCCLGFDE